MSAEGEKKQDYQVSYYWDLRTDQLTWFGEEASLFNGLAQTGRNFTNQVNSLDRGKRTASLEQIQETSSEIQLRYHLDTPQGKELWVEENSSVAELAPDGRIVSIVGKLNLLTPPEARIKLATTDRGVAPVSSITKNIEDAHQQNLQLGTNYAYLIVSFGGGLYEEGANLEALKGHAEKELSGLICTTDTLCQLDTLSWLVLFDACETAELEYKRALIKATLQEKFSGREFWCEGASLNPSQDNVEESLKAVRSHWQQGKLSLDKLLMTQSTVVAEPGQDMSETRQAIAEIEQALGDNRFCLALQPIVDAKTFDPVYFECLARLIDTDGNIIPAGKFISLCEQGGLIKRLDLHVLQLALTELQRNPDLRISLNVSAITATDPSWLNLLRTYLNTWPELAPRLVIEMTETAIFFDLQESLRFMEQVRGLGCKLAIDDFGAGYLSFSHIHSQLVQVVKIDGQLIKNIDKSADDLNTVRALISLVRPHGIQCVAEFVESEAIALLLHDEGVDYLQGYFTGLAKIIRP